MMNLSKNILPGVVSIYDLKNSLDCDGYDSNHDFIILKIKPITAFFDGALEMSDLIKYGNGWML